MVLTSRTHTTLFNAAAAADAPTAKALIRLPLSVVPHYEQRCTVTGAIVPVANKPLFRTNLWTTEEHERFLHGLEIFPNGPWKDVAKIVGTKTTRQTMTHAQKYRQKIERHLAAKPKATKSRRAKAEPSAISSEPAISSTTFQDMLATGTSFTESLAAFDSAAQAPTRTHGVASPTDVFSGAFSASFLDQELDSLLESLALPLPIDGDHMLPATYADELGVFSF